MAKPDAWIVRHGGLQPYLPVAEAMRTHASGRAAAGLDELWLLQHPPVFTIGRAGDPRHLLAPGSIPVHRTDRGGQVTYHGPGQLVAYVLVDLARRGLGIRTLVSRIEEAMVDTLNYWDLQAERQETAPGVYVGGRKIGALGLRVRRGISYHGLSLNVTMDLAPFGQINPCGYPGLEVTQLRDELPPGRRPPDARLVAVAADRLVRELSARLGYNDVLHRDRMES